MFKYYLKGEAYVDKTYSRRNAFWFRSNNVCNEPLDEDYMQRLLETQDCE